MLLLDVLMEIILHVNFMDFMFVASNSHSLTIELPKVIQPSVGTILASNVNNFRFVFHKIRNDGYHRSRILYSEPSSTYSLNGQTDLQKKVVYRN